MAAPTFVAATTALGTNGSGANITLTAPAGLQSGDFQVCFVVGGTGSETFDAPPSGWTLAASTTGTGSNTFQLRVFTSTTALTAVTFTKSGDRGWAGTRLAYRGHTGMVAGSASAQYNSASTTSAIPAKTPVNAESLVIAGSVQDHFDTGTNVTATPPTSFTERVDFQGSSTSLGELLALTVADRGTTVANQAVSGNFTWTASHDSASWSLVLDAPFTAIGPVTDSGPGVDAPTVDKTEIRTLTEAAPSADPATVLADHDALTDSGASVETITIDQLTTVSVLDDGAVGADSLTVTDFGGADLVEAGDGVDAISLVQTNFVDFVEDAPGADTIILERQLSPLSDSGVGVDTASFVVATDLVDSGVGVDSLTVVVIPFTAVLPLVEGTIYDLVVVARVPQASGPPTFIEIDPIEWKSLTYSNTLKEPQELSASCLISSVPESIWQRLRALHELATELWLYRNGERVFAGPLQGWQTSGEDLQLSCKGLMQYLRSMVVHTNQVFTNVDQSTVVKTLVDQWQNLAYGNFGIDTSQITPSGQLRTVTYLRDELHIVGARVEELGKLATGFDAEIDPATRELLLWSPLKGVDRATGEDAIIFDARNITSGDILCSVAGGDLASEAYGNAGSAGTDEALFSMASNDELRARYGRTGVTGSWSNEKSQAALDAYVQGLLDARAEVLLVPGPRCRVTPDADLAAYAVGDSISYDLAEQLGINQAFRIRKQTVTVSSTGQESVDLEFV